jgi:hypothetical protein
MGRRYGGPKTGDYIGTGAMEKAIKQINKLMEVSFNVLTEYTPTVDQTIAMLFDPDVIARATAAKGVVRDPMMTLPYTIKDYVVLNLSYDGAQCLPIKPALYMQQQHLIGPLRGVVDQMEEIYLKFEHVKVALRWLNKNATKAAIRYYWPTILQLLPSEFAEYQECPQRFAEPNKIETMSQLFRDTATTMASAKLLSDGAVGRGHSSLLLTFNTRHITVGDGRHSTDQVSAYI